MKKVFHDLHRWKKRWFRKLGPEGRDIWNWMLDAVYEFHGIWEVDLDAIAFDLGYPVSLERIQEVFKGRMYDIGDGKVFFPGAIVFQHGELSEDCNPHKPIIRTLKNRGLWEIYLKELNSTGNSNFNSSVTVMNKNKNKAKDKEQDKGLGEFEGKGVLVRPASRDVAVQSPADLEDSIPLIRREQFAKRYPDPAWVRAEIENCFLFHTADPAKRPTTPGQWMRKLESWLLSRWDERPRGSPKNTADYDQKLLEIFKQNKTGSET